jgi:mannose-6-phosphate isomerase-like protein (cupin superfamily)
VPPGVTTRLHAVRGTVERYVLVSGEGIAEVDGVTTTVGPGDRVLVPADAPQRIANTGATDLLFYCVCTPRFVPEAYLDLGDPDPPTA